MLVTVTPESLPQEPTYGLKSNPGAQRAPARHKSTQSIMLNGFSIDDDEHQHPKSQASARGLKEGLTPAGLAVASRHHPGESGRAAVAAVVSAVREAGGGGVWGDSGVRLHLSPDEAGDTVSTTPPVMYRPWGSRAPQPLTYVGARVAKQDYNAHSCRKLQGCTSHQVTTRF